VSKRRSKPSPAEARIELDRLDARVDETKEAYVEARDATGRAWVTSRDVAIPLAEYHSKRRPGQPRDLSNAEPRRLTLDLLSKIDQEDLILEPLDPSRPAAGLRIVDPRPYRSLAEARDEATAARCARDAFVHDCRGLLEEAAGQEAIARIKRALDCDEPDALRDALTAVGVGCATGTSAMTTEDL